MLHRETINKNHVKQSSDITNTYIKKWKIRLKSHFKVWNNCKDGQKYTSYSVKNCIKRYRYWNKHESTVPLKNILKLGTFVWYRLCHSVPPWAIPIFKQIKGHQHRYFLCSQHFLCKRIPLHQRKITYSTCDTISASGVTVPFCRVIADCTECCFKTGIKSKRFRYLFRARLPVHARKIRL
jgi:hypothetical protein